MSVLFLKKYENSQVYPFSSKMIHTYFIVFTATAVFYCAGATVPENPCGINEAKYPCGRRCEARCNAEIPTFCKGIMCLGFTCRCKNGYARDPETDGCVAIQNCPPNRCDTGEVLGPCGTTCEGTCTEPYQPEVCERIDCQGVSCRCDLQGGFVRNEETGKCVRTENCPKS